MAHPESDTPSPHPELGISNEDLQKLSQYDNIFLVDDSQSMRLSGCWSQARDCIMKLATVTAKYNSNGIEVHFLNHKPNEGDSRHLNVSTEHEVGELFGSRWSLSMGSKIGRRLAELTKNYLEKCGGVSPPRPRNYIIVTDGRPRLKAPQGDPQTLKACLEIVAATLENNNCPPSQLGFQFVQVGNNRSATEYLEELDGDRKLLKRDIVDTVKYSRRSTNDSSLIQKILLGGINRVYDAQTI